MDRPRLMVGTDGVDARALATAAAVFGATEPSASVGTCGETPAERRAMDEGVMGFAMYPWQ